MSNKQLGGQPFRGRPDKGSVVVDRSPRAERAPAEPQVEDPGKLEVWVTPEQWLRSGDVSEVYDREEHRWDPDYVFSERWFVHMSLASRGSVLRGVSRLRWRVESAEGLFEPQESEREPWMSPFTQETLRVSGAGEVVVSVAISFEDGTIRRDETRVSIDDFLVVSIGDSFSSGQGNPDVPGSVDAVGGSPCELSTLGQLLSGAGLGHGGPAFMRRQPKWLEPKAWRSLRSAPALAAKQAQDEYAGRLVRFVTVATSGATIDKGLLAPQLEWQSVGQVEEVGRLLHKARDHRERPTRQCDVLVLSIGCNDVGFAFVLESFTGDKVSLLDLVTVGRSQSEVMREIEADLARLPALYDKLAAAIDEYVRPRCVLIAEYPAGLFDGADGSPTAGCGIFDLTGPTGLSLADARIMREVGQRLNDEVRAAAARHGWTVVDGIDAGFAGHGYCSGQSYFVAAEASCRRQGDLEGLMHPNGKGTQVAADRIEAVLTAQLDRLEASTWRPRPHERPAGPAGRTGSGERRNERVPARPAGTLPTAVDDLRRGPQSVVRPRGSEE